MAVTILILVADKLNSQGVFSFLLKRTFKQDFCFKDMSHLGGIRSDHNPTEGSDGVRDVAEVVIKEAGSLFD